MKRKTGFTLVELLIVIGIILILVALLLPAVSMVRQRSRAARCASHVRQVGAAIEPTRQKVRQRFTVSNWQASIMPFLQSEEVVLDCPDNVPPDGESSYGMNHRAMRMGARDAGKIVLLDDTLPVVTVVTNSLDSQDDWPNTVAPRHMGYVNVLFHDGHVTLMDPDVIDPRYCQPYEDYWRPRADDHLFALEDCLGPDEDAPTQSGSGGGAESTDGSTDSTTGGTTDSSSGTTSDTTSGTSGGTGGGTDGSGTDGSGTDSSTDGTGSACPEGSAGPLLHYTYDDPLDLGRDSSGNGNHGTVYGSPTTESTSGGGYALVLDGTNDKIEVPHSSALNPTCMTVMAWVRVPPLRNYPNHNNGTASIVTSRHVTLAPVWIGGYNLYITPSADSGGNCNWWAGCSQISAWNGQDTGAGYWYHMTPNYPLGLSEWEHVAGVWETIDNTDGVLKIRKTVYHNGSNSASTPVGEENIYAINENRKFRVGVGSLWDPEDLDAYWFTGAMDDLRVYDRALTSGEISAAMNEWEGP